MIYGEVTKDEVIESDDDDDNNDIVGNIYVLNVKAGYKSTCGATAEEDHVEAPNNPNNTINSANLKG